MSANACSSSEWPAHDADHGKSQGPAEISAPRFSICWTSSLVGAENERIRTVVLVVFGKWRQFRDVDQQRQEERSRFAGAGRRRRRSSRALVVQSVMRGPLDRSWLIVSDLVDDFEQAARQFGLLPAPHGIRNGAALGGACRSSP